MSAIGARLSLMTGDSGERVIIEADGVYCQVWWDATPIRDDYNRPVRGSGVFEVVVKDTDELVGGRTFARRDFRVAEAHRRDEIADYAERWMVSQICQHRGPSGSPLVISEAPTF